MKSMKVKLAALLAALCFAGVATAQLIYGNTFPFWNVSGPLKVTGVSTLSGGATITGTTSLAAPTVTGTLAGASATWSGTTVTTGMTTVTGGILGSATNDAAAAGNVGELLTTTVAAGSAVAGGATTVSANVTSVSLTAGDWDVSAVCDYVWTGITATVIQCGYGTTTGTLLTQAGGGGVGTDPVSIHQATFGTTLTGTQNLLAPTVRVSLASTTTIFLVAQMTYSAGSFTQYGTIRARRVR